VTVLKFEVYIVTSFCLINNISAITHHINNKMHDICH